MVIQSIFNSMRRTAAGSDDHETLMNQAIRAILLAALLAGGCAQTPRDDGFADVRDDVHHRIGQRVQWNRQTHDDQAADASIRLLLSNDLTADRAVQIALLNNHALQATYEEIGI